MKELTSKQLYHYLIIGLAAAMLFIPFLGGVHLFDWDEINFAESAREMIASNDYLHVQINFEPFWEKPPLFIWLQVLSMKIFGINEFAARFPNAVCGMVTLLVLYAIGKRTHDSRFGIIWVMAYAGSLLSFLYFKSGIIDPWYNLFIFLGLYFFVVYINEKNSAIFRLVLSAIFIGLALLTKGPAAILIFILSVSAYFLINKFYLRISIADIIIYMLVLAVVGGFWFILLIIKGNFDIIIDFVAYQIRLFRTEDSGHGGFLLYHFVILLIGVFPASLIALPSFFNPGKVNHMQKEMRTWMLILFWVVLILFTIVKTKIVHYSSLCYFPLTYLAAMTVYQWPALKIIWKKSVAVATMIVASIYAILIILVSYIDSFKHILIERNFIHDQFAVECLKADGGWKGYEWFAGLLLLAGIIVFIVWWIRGRTQKSMMMIFPVISVFMFVTLLLITPRIERYSQHAAVEFFDSVSNEDAYLKTLGYKSYIHLFYGKIKKQENPLAKYQGWLLEGDIDKTAYFAIKVDKKERYLHEYPELKMLYEKNGFVFCQRKPR